MDSYNLLQRYIEKFRVVLDAIGINTPIQADCLTGGVYFFTHREQSFGWHQDRDSYYTYQNHYNYLNFYIPIIKPDINQSNLSLIPFDRLQAKTPDFYNRMLGKGASLLGVCANKTYYEDENMGGTSCVLDYPLDELAETPALDVGTLLILRGNVIHRTQDTNTLRVALSVRFANSCHKISKSVLVNGGTKKLEMMAHDHIRYQQILDYIEVLGTAGVMPIGAIFGNSSYQAFKAKRVLSKFEFCIYLLHEKIKMGLFVDAIIIIGEIIKKRCRSLVVPKVKH